MSQQVDIKFDFPFDLNSLFNLNYSFEVLKQSIEYLARTQAAHGKILIDLQSNTIIGSSNNSANNVNHNNEQPHNAGNHAQVINQFNNQQQVHKQEEHKQGHQPQKQVQQPANDSGSNNQSNNTGLNSDILKMVRDHDNVIKNLRNEVNQLRDKADTQDRTQSGLQKSLDGYKASNDQLIKDLQQALADSNGRLAQTENTVNLLKAMGGVSSGDGSGGTDLLDALTIMVENLRKECYANFGSRLDTDMLKRKIDEMQHHMNDQDKQLHNHEIGLIQCRDITDTNKLDIDELKSQMKKLAADMRRGTHESSALNQIESTGSLSAIPNNQNNQIQQQIDELLRKLAKLEKDMDNKLDCDVFDNALRAMIGNMDFDGSSKTKVQVNVPSQQTASQFTTKEVNQIKQMIERMPIMEETQQRILKDLKNLNLQTIRDQIEIINKQLLVMASKEDLSEIDSRLKKQEQKTDKHSKDIQSILDQLYDMKQSIASLGNTSNFATTNDIMILRSRMEYVETAISSQKKLHNELQKALDDFKAELYKKLESFDANLLKYLESELNSLKNDYGLFKEDSNSTLKTVLDQLQRKADKEELHLLEAKILEKLNEMLQKLLGMFADKKDTYKRLSNLEKNMKSIFELLMSKNSPRQNEDDAMFTKKPLNGISCASCERNITNLSGNMADYQPWKKLPFREPNDRISKYGPGFSKILSMMKPEQQLSQEQSRLDISQNQMRISNTIQNQEQSFHAETSISVEMPQAVMTAVKNSARTGIQFNKNATGNFGSRKNSHAKHPLLEESPSRDFSAERLPQLNIKVRIVMLTLLQKAFQ